MHFTALGVEILLIALIVVALICGIIIIRRTGKPRYGIRILSGILALLILLLFLALFILIIRVPPSFQFS